MAFFSFLSWFRPWWKTSETDYETVLGRLSKDISSVQSRLVHINQRERRASVTLTLYAILLWLAYAVLVWFWNAEKRLDMTKGERLRLWAPVALGFVVIISTRFLVRWWYRRIASGEETHLRSLQRTRRKKIDEIKLATRYDHLRSLLEKYDDTAVPVAVGKKGTTERTRSARTGGPLARKELEQAPKPSGQTQLQGPAGQEAKVGGGEGGESKNGVVVQGPVGAVQSSQRQEQFQRTWMDRLADKILGAEMGGQQVAAEQRYALICHICFTHNGLCPKEDWEEVQYICPRCGTFNSRRPSSAPVSSPWGKSARERQRTDSMASSSPPASPSPPRTLAERATPSGDDEKLEDEQRRDEIIKDKDDDHREDRLRSRKSAASGEERLEEMEVD